jgi:asparagine synthase (glutamine-hydrolysing)
MCGFVMTLSANGPPDVAQASRMADFLAHRGPDDSGEFAEYNVAFAFRRLAIFDVESTSHQPMISPNGRYVIVFNGAIYNFIELRRELAALGHDFRTNGDTEVLLAAYQQWGAECLPRLNGMWAFVIYDRSERRIFAARDRFGVKPLYWFRDARGLVLASEIKTIRDSRYADCQPNWQTVAAFLLEGALDVDDRTFYSGVYRFPAGCFLEGDGRSAPAFQRYWSVVDAAAAVEITEPVEEFRSLFADAVRLRMRADVGIGTFLSGGLDSTSIITNMAALQGDAATAPINAVCYSDPDYDETEFIQATLKDIGAIAYTLTPQPEGFWPLFERHLWHQDEPVHSWNSAVIFQLMRVASDHGMKVMLSGHGADEVLAGYPTYFVDYWSDLAQAGEIREMRAEVKAFAEVHGLTTTSLYRSVALRCGDRLKRHVPGYDRLAGFRRRVRVNNDAWVSLNIKEQWRDDHYRWATNLSGALLNSVERQPLPVYLRVEDRNAMAHAVEVRMPFLDHRVVAFAFRLRSQWKLRGGYTKVVLREAVTGRVPDVVRKRARKFGFPVSLSRWVTDGLRDRCRDLVSTQAVRESGVWNVEAIKRDLEADNKTPALTQRMFDFAQFVNWYAFSRFGLVLSVAANLLEYE